MRRALAVLVSVIAGAAAPAAGAICENIDPAGNFRHSAFAPNPGGRDSACADQKNGVEPELRYPQDPHKAPADGQRGTIGYACHLAAGAREMACIDKAQIGVDGDIRTAELFVGRPNRVRRAGARIVVDCKSGAVMIEDRGGGQAIARPEAPVEVARALGEDMCTASTPVSPPR